MYVVLCVLDNPEHLDEVLEGWDTIGVSGATILASTGVNRRRRASQEGASLMRGGGGEHHCTLFVIVPDIEIASRCLEAVEGVTGSLDHPDTGVLAAWPLSLVKGVPALPKKREV